MLLLHCSFLFSTWFFQMFVQLAAKGIFLVAIVLELIRIAEKVATFFGEQENGERRRELVFCTLSLYSNHSLGCWTPYDSFETLA